MRSLSAAHPAADHEAWLGYLRSPDLAAVTITVTEAGYFRRPDGGLDVTRPPIAADLDVLPFEDRKIWLLNGAHSLLAYAGSIIGHATVADAVASQTCMEWLSLWWDEASVHLSQPPAEIASYRAALLTSCRYGYFLSSAPNAPPAACHPAPAEC